jgi:hypothetical protein
MENVVVVVGGSVACVVVVVGGSVACVVVVVVGSVGAVVVGGGGACVVVVVVGAGRMVVVVGCGLAAVVVVVVVGLGAEVGALVAGVAAGALPGVTPVNGSPEGRGRSKGLGGAPGLVVVVVAGGIAPKDGGFVVGPGLKGPVNVVGGSVRTANCEAVSLGAGLPI